MFDHATPERSLAQRREALERANAIRSARAEFKRGLKHGEVSIIDALLEPPEWLGSARVFDLLLAIPKYGRVKANNLLQITRISPSKTIGGLSPRQRTELAAFMRSSWSSPSRPANLRPLVLPPVSAREAVVAPTVFERRVLSLAISFGAINRSNSSRAANALQSNPGAVTRACADLQRKALMDPTGAPTGAGRAHSSVLPAAAAA